MQKIFHFLEIVTYGANISNSKGKEYEKVKPHKAMKVFSHPQYNVDVLKVEVPVNMNYVESYSNEPAVYTKKRSQKLFC